MFYRNPITSVLFPICLTLLCAWPAPAPAQTKPLELFVAPQGRDSAPGTATAPLATVGRARDLIREMKKQGRLPSSVKVVLRGGTFVLGKTLAFTADDACSRTLPVVYTAYPGETPILSGGESNGPALERLLSIEGTDRAGASGLRFEHLSFRHAEARTAGAHNLPAAQVPACVTLKRARNCLFYDCSFTGLWSSAAEVGEGSADNRFIACRFEDLGGGAVKIASGSEHTTVADCTIGLGGQVWSLAAGVQILDSPRNRILHNEIANYEGVAIACGEVGDYGAAHTCDNQIEFNHIHNLARGAAGGITTRGTQAGSLIRGNVIHDIAGWGIYADGGTSFLLVEGNLVYRTQSSGFQQNFGRDNVVRNNIFAFGSERALRRILAERVRSFIFENNIIYQAVGGMLFDGIWTDGNYSMRENVFWREGGTPDFGGHSLAQWQRLRLDVKSVIADPLLANPDKGDFELKPESPAFKKGFRSIDPSLAGPRPLNPREVAPEQWPVTEEPPRVIVEGRLEDAEFNGVKGGERFLRRLSLKANKPSEVTYHLWNCGLLPASGEVLLRILPDDAPVRIEGGHVCRYNLKPNEKALFRIHLRSRSDDVRCRLVAIPRGEGLAPSALYFTSGKR